MPEPPSETVAEPGVEPQVPKFSIFTAPALYALYQLLLLHKNISKFSDFRQQHHILICIHLLGCQSKIIQTEVAQNTDFFFFFSQFWGLQVQDQGVSKFGFS